MCFQHQANLKAKKIFLIDILIFRMYLQPTFFLRSLDLTAHCQAKIEILFLSFKIQFRGFQSRLSQMISNPHQLYPFFMISTIPQLNVNFLKYFTTLLSQQFLHSLNLFNKVSCLILPACNIQRYRFTFDLTIKQYITFYIS